VSLSLTISGIVNDSLDEEKTIEILVYTRREIEKEKTELKLIDYS
jgi:hypothetical protein